MMTKRTTITVLLVFAFAATALLFAQAPPNPPSPEQRAQHRLKFLTTVLNLSAAQQQQATTIFTNAGNNEDALHKTMQTAHQNLDNAVKNNDAAGIDQAAATIGSTMSQIVSSQAKARAAFYQILTPDQQNKLNELDSERHGDVMMMRPAFHLH